MAEEYTERDIPLFDNEGKFVKVNIDLETLEKQIHYYSLEQLLALHCWAARESLGPLHPYNQAIEGEIKRRIKGE